MQVTAHFFFYGVSTLQHTKLFIHKEGFVSLAICSSTVDYIHLFTSPDHLYFCVMCQTQAPLIYLYVCALVLIKIKCTTHFMKHLGACPLVESINLYYTVPHDLQMVRLQCITFYSITILYTDSACFVVRG